MPWPFSSKKNKTENIYFSVIHFARKNIEETIEGIKSSKKHTNATLVTVNSKTSPRVSIYSDTTWKYYPALGFSDRTRLVSYFPTVLLSDDYEWDESLSSQESREALQKASKNNTSVNYFSSSYKPTVNSALEKSQQQWERFKKREIDLQAQENLEYHNQDGNLMSFTPRPARFENTLKPNECHIKPGLHNIQYVTVTHKDLHEADNKLSRSLMIFSTSLLVEELEQERARILSNPSKLAELAKTEKEKLEYLESERVYFSQLTEIYTKQIDEISKISGADFNIDSLEDSRLKEALLRKVKKDRNFAKTGEHGKNNALTWLKKNMTKCQSYIADLSEDIQSMQQLETQEGGLLEYVRSELTKPLQISVYNSQKGTHEIVKPKEFEKYKKEALRYINQYTQQESRGKKRDQSAQQGDDFLYKMSLYQLPTSFIDNILADVSPEKIKRMLSYNPDQEGRYINLRDSVSPMSNILSQAVNLNNKALFQLTLNLIKKHYPEKQEELLSDIITIARWNRTEHENLDFKMITAGFLEVAKEYYRTPNSKYGLIYQFIEAFPPSDRKSISADVLSQFPNLDLTKIKFPERLVKKESEVAVQPAVRPGSSPARPSSPTAEKKRLVGTTTSISDA